MPALKNIILLSEKSSGSSALQLLLFRFADVRLVSNTIHNRKETLYWTKAASILGLPQVKMVDSVVPLNKEKAREELVSFLRSNLDDFILPVDERELIFEGWKRLCETYSPIFLEKSPHHLCQWSALKLILEFMERESSVDVLLLGLIRNPLDTIYSQYERWRSIPKKTEQQWRTAYRNLLKLKEIMGDKVVIVRYEDIIFNLKYLGPVFKFMGVDLADADEEYLHQESLHKWRDDKFFRFALSEKTIDLAIQYGYREEELRNRPHIFWPIVRDVSRQIYKLTKRIKTSKDR